MNIALWVTQGLLAAAYMMAGLMKVFQTAKTKEQMRWAKNRPEAFIRFVGTMELLGAIGLILPLATGIWPALTALAALGLALIQLLAIVTEHLPNKEYAILPANVILLALAVFVIVGRWALVIA